MNKSGNYLIDRQPHLLKRKFCVQHISSRGGILRWQMAYEKCAATTTIESMDIVSKRAEKNWLSLRCSVPLEQKHVFAKCHMLSGIYSIHLGSYWLFV